jgi:hypothetical protein
MKIAVIMTTSEEDFLALEVFIEMTEHLCENTKSARYLSTNLKLTSHFRVSVLLAVTDIDEIELGTTISKLLGEYPHLILIVDGIVVKKRLGQSVQICKDPHHNRNVLGAKRCILKVVSHCLGESQSSFRGPLTRVLQQIVIEDGTVTINQDCHIWVFVLVGVRR